MTLDARKLHPRELAYLGDAVFELHVRSLLLASPLTPSERHQRAVARVRAKAQAETLQALEPILTEAERDIVRRARNLKPPPARGVDQNAYRLSTAFEALVGFTYAVEPKERLAELLAIADSVALTQGDQVNG